MVILVESNHSSLFLIWVGQHSELSHKVNMDAKRWDRAR